MFNTKKYSMKKVIYDANSKESERAHFICENKSRLYNMFFGWRGTYTVDITTSKSNKASKVVIEEFVMSLRDIAIIEKLD